MMDINKLMDAIRNHPNADDEMLREMEEMLEIETQKPENERNYDTIEALSAAICDASIPQEVQNSIITNGIESIMQQNKSSKKKITHRKLFKPIAAVCACLLVLIGANAWSIHASGTGIFKRVYSYFSNHIEFGFDSEDDSCSAEVSVGFAEDTYGIRNECEQYGFSPLIPRYLPDGFEQTATEHHELAHHTNVSFTYKYGNQTISLDYEYYPDINEIHKVRWGFPSDSHNVSEMEISGVTLTISKEDQQYRAFFLLDHTVYTVFTNDLDYTQSEMILRSMFE